MPSVVNKVVKYTGGDYSTIADAVAAFNSRNLISNDEQWNILIDESASGNLQWTLTSEVLISNANVDATRFLCIKPNAGKGIKDSAGRLTNALRYNASNGVAIYDNGAFRFSIEVAAAHTLIEGLQFFGNNADFNASLHVNAASVAVRDCVFETSTAATTVNNVYGGNSSGAASFVNCSFGSHRPFNIRPMEATFRNCTFIRNSSSSTGSYVALHAGAGTMRMLNCAAFGFAVIASGGNNLLNTSNYNATDLSAPTNWGASSLSSLTAADQVESVTSGSIDARAKAAGSLDGAASRDQANTNDLDIVGSARSTSAPTIGAWEVAGAPNAPTGVTVGSITATSASVSWTDASSDETGFKVRYAPSPYSSWTTATGSVAASPYTVTGLSDGTSYKAGVAAFNGNGDSTWAESGVFTTTALTRLRPSADTSKGSWSASSGSVLYSMIDEANADDTDYITAATNTTCKIKFENGTDPVSGANHLLRVRARGTGGTLRAELVQSATPETTIASWSITYTASFTDFDLSLTSAQADAITDYSALYVKLISS